MSLAYTEKSNTTKFVSRTKMVSTGDNGTLKRFFEANPIARGIEPQTWAAEVRLMPRFTIGFRALRFQLVLNHNIIAFPANFFLQEAGQILPGFSLYNNSGEVWLIGCHRP